MPSKKQLHTTNNCKYFKLYEYGGLIVFKSVYLTMAQVQFFSSLFPAGFQ
jgi:hypothetical protein